MRRPLLSLIAGIMFTAGIGTAVTQTNIPALRLDDETRKLLREATEDKWFKKDALFSTLIGGLLAVVGGFGAVWMEAKHKEKEDAEFSANVLRAIRRELETLEGICKSAIDASAADRSDGTIVEARLALTHDCFTVFTANSVHLGKIESDLSRRIVTIYVLFKTLIEEFRINSGLFVQWSEIINEIVDREFETVDHKIKRDKALSLLVEHTRHISKVGVTLREATSEFYTLLDQRNIK